MSMRWKSVQEGLPELRTPVVVAVPQEDGERLIISGVRKTKKIFETAIGDVVPTYWSMPPRIHRADRRTMERAGRPTLA